jgi:predicted nucleic acid-binding protein
MIALLDTNILLDVLAQRQPFLADSARVWTLVEEGQVEGVVSALSLANIFYVTRRLAGAEPARKAVRIMHELFSLVALDERVMSDAVNSRMADFEDAIQYFSAVVAKADCLLTRNKKHFPGKGLAIMTPDEFLEMRHDD